jgi:chaperonin GroEL
MFRIGLRNVTAGADAFAICRGIQQAVEKVTKDLGELARPVKANSRDDIVHVASISANNDQAIGKVLADCLREGRQGRRRSRSKRASQPRPRRSGRGHAIRSRLPLPALRHQPGRNGPCVLEKCLVLIHEEKISNVKKIVPLLEAVAKSNKPAADHRRGHRGRSPGHARGQQASRHPQGLRRQGAGLRRSPQGHAARTSPILTGGKPIMKDLGIDLEQVELIELGQVQAGHASSRRQHDHG